MYTKQQLQDELRRIDRKSYPAYKDLKGSYRFDDYTLTIDHVQGDPFASPSHLTARIPLDRAGFPAEYTADFLHRDTLADFLLRRFYLQLGRLSFQAKGSGKSGLISVSRCGQEILSRTACQVSDKEIVVRFFVGFPARGRTIDSGELEKILFSLLPRGIREGFYYTAQDKAALRAQMDLREDQAYIRKEIEAKGLMAFVGNGSVLPRESGISSKPMKGAVPFTSPKSLEITLDLPHKGPVTGMGVPRGVILIVGGGYHGKSTLLDALQNGVYDHINGDGREYVITDDTALKLRAEDGRFVKDVDISPFIGHLPNKKDTVHFSTEDASGSTSQAAGIMEAIEAGSRVFLMDEDTSAANFMVRDRFMQAVVAPDKEPITPYLERVRELYETKGISTVLVAGSSGAFFHVADLVIQMDAYQPKDITDTVRSMLTEYPMDFSARKPLAVAPYKRVMTRQREERSHRNYYGDRVSGPERLKVKVHGRTGFSIGKADVELSALEQLVDSEQTSALAYFLKEAVESHIDGNKTLADIVKYIYSQLEKKGLSYFTENGYVGAGYAMPRLQEIFGCFNRYRRP